MTRTSPAQCRTLTLGVVAVSLLLSLSPLREVDGLLAAKSTWYYDDSCEMAVGYSFFMSAASYTDGLGTDNFNECALNSDNSSAIVVCDAATGEFGMNTFSDKTCTELQSEGSEIPLSGCSSFGLECTDGEVCSLMTECVDDDEPAALSPTAINFKANEYHDASCTDPTGNSMIVAEMDSSGGTYDGGCKSSGLGGYAMSQCHEDGSFETQFFSPEDDTCSGDVWMHATSPTEFSPPICSTEAANGRYYGYVSCTTDAASVFLGTSAPASAMTGAPAPTSNLDDDTATDVQPPTMPDTPAPTTDVGMVPTAPATAIDDDGVVGSSLNPIADANDDNEGNTPSPASDIKRGVNASLSDVSGLGREDELGNNEAALANGTVGTGRGITMGMMVLVCTVWVVVSVAIQGVSC